MIYALRYLYFGAIATTVLLLGSCDDEMEEITNSRPTIDRVIVPQEVKAGEKVKLEVVAHDADGDGLTYNWEVSEGTVDSVGVWTVPTEATSAIVFVHVSDGVNTKYQNQCRDCCPSRPFKAYCAEGDGVDSSGRVSDGEHRPGGSKR